MWRVAVLLPHAASAVVCPCVQMWVSGGVALDGSPVVINCKSAAAESDHEAQFQLIVYTLERALRCHPSRPAAAASTPPSSLQSECRQQWVWLLDMRNFTRSSSTPISETKRVVDALMQHYVERLGMAVILDAPKHFKYIFNVHNTHTHTRTDCCDTLASSHTYNR